MKIEVVDFNSSHLIAVKKLGKENASTLGFFPEGAFDERAQKKQILAAVNENDECIGYLLYRISNRKAKIVHLCVDKSVRNEGAARNLVENLKSITKDLLGIGLKCRRDYESTQVWGKFGFVPINESEGRGKDPKALIYWELSHGHPTLFDLDNNADNKNKIDIVIDANVFFDIDNPTRDGYVESSSLKADWLEDSLNICLVDEIYQEIVRCEDVTTRKASRDKASHFKNLPFDKKQAEIIYEEIKNLFPKKEEAFAERDKSDIRQVSAAICADAQYFITRDAVLLKDNISSEIFNRFGLKIMRPADLIIQIDEIRRESEYQPARLSGTAIKIALVKSGQEEHLTKTFQQQESKTTFQTRLRAYLSDLKNYVCWQVVDEHSNSLALFVYKKSDKDYFEVPLFRIKKNKLSPTLSRHLIIEAIHNSIAKDKIFIKITDSFINPEVKAGLVEEGFIETEKGWTKFHLKTVSTRKETSKQLAHIIVETERQREFLNNLSDILNKEYFELNAEIFADIEKSLYPIKITDSLLPCFIIPIQPSWAKELFDKDLANQGLFGAKRDLALRKEQVYYRSKLNSGGLKSPARILWYVSQGKTNYINVGAIRACSLVDEVIVEKPKIIFNLFKRLGIYEWKDVYETAKGDINNEIMAIKFSHTQLFSNPVKRERIEKITEENNHGLQLFSPYNISQEVFIEIYKEGIIKTN